MSYASQLTIAVMNYISILGLLISGLCSILVIDKKRKLLFLFLVLFFAGVLSFVYYSGVLFFLIGIIAAFFFLLLYLFVLQIEVFGSPEYPEITDSPGGLIKNKILNIIISIFFCAAAGYPVYRYTDRFLKGVKMAEESGAVPIVGWGDISGQLFTEYSLLLIIITVSLFLSFLWAMAIVVRKK